MFNDIPLIAVVSASALLPFLIASGTCYVKFSIVFIMIRNALGLQQVPSNMTLNGVALLISMFVMMPVTTAMYDDYSNRTGEIRNARDMAAAIEEVSGPYRTYLEKYSDPALVRFFARTETGSDGVAGDAVQPSIFALLPAYALSEIKSAFTIGFYLYLPFVVVDLVISSILLSLGMMMMSPVTISVPVKLILFVAMDGWRLLAEGLIRQYM